MLGFLQNLGRNGPFNTSPLTPGINGSFPAIGPRRLPLAPQDYPIDESTAQGDQQPSDYDSGYSVLPPAPGSLPGSAAASSNSSQATANGWEGQAVKSDDGESAPPDRTTPQQQSVQRQQVSEDMPYVGAWSQRDNPDNFEPEGGAGSPEAQAAGRSESTPWIPSIATVAAQGEAAQQPQQPQQVQRRPVAPAIKPLPERPKPGILRQLAGAVVGNWVPSIGQKITYGDYPGQVADWNATMAGIERQKKMEVAAQREQSEATLRMSQADKAQAQANDLRRGKVTSLGAGVGVDAAGNVINPNPRPTTPADKRVQIDPETAAKIPGLPPDPDGNFYISESIYKEVVKQALTQQGGQRLKDYEAALINSGVSPAEVKAQAGKLFLAELLAERNRKESVGNRADSQAALYDAKAEGYGRNPGVKRGSPAYQREVMGEANTALLEHRMKKDEQGKQLYPDSELVNNLKNPEFFTHYTGDFRNDVRGAVSTIINKANGKKGNTDDELINFLSGGAAKPQVTAKPSVLPKQQSGLVKMKHPDGRVGDVEASRVAAAEAQGYTKVN